MTTTHDLDPRPRHDVSGCSCDASGALRHRHRWFAVLAAMATATALWGISHSLLGIDLTVRQAGRLQHVDSLAVTLTSLVVGFAGWVSLTLLERRTARARTIWRALAAAVLLVSLAGPASAVTAEAAAALAAMHLVVGAILLVWLPGQWRSARD